MQKKLHWFCCLLQAFLVSKRGGLILELLSPHGTNLGALSPKSFSCKSSEFIYFTYLFKMTKIRTKIQQICNCIISQAKQKLGRIMAEFKESKFNRTCALMLVISTNCDIVSGEFPINVFRSWISTSGAESKAAMSDLTRVNRLPSRWHGQLRYPETFSHNTPDWQSVNITKCISR